MFHPELQNIHLFNIETCGKALLPPLPATLDVGWQSLLRARQLAFDTVTAQIVLALKTRVGLLAHHPSSQPVLTHAQALHKATAALQKKTLVNAA